MVQGVLRGIVPTTMVQCTARGGRAIIAPWKATANEPPRVEALWVGAFGAYGLGPKFVRRAQRLSRAAVACPADPADPGYLTGLAESRRIPPKNCVLCPTRVAQGRAGGPQATTERETPGYAST